MITRNFFHTFLILLLLLLVFFAPLSAQELVERDMLHRDIKDVVITIDSLDRKELFQFKKELLLFGSQSRQRTNHLSIERQWQMRFLFLIFSGSFLGLCFSSSTFQKVDISSYYYLFSIFFIVFLFFFYDAHEGSLRDRSVKTGEVAVELLNNLENKSYHELKNIRPFLDPYKPGFSERQINRICQIKKVDYFCFYVTTQSQKIVI